jgi:hypothetical protein
MTTRSGRWGDYGSTPLWQPTILAVHDIWQYTIMTAHGYGQRRITQNTRSNAKAKARLWKLTASLEELHVSDWSEEMVQSSRCPIEQLLPTQTCKHFATPRYAHTLHQVIVCLTCMGACHIANSKHPTISLHGKVDTNTGKSTSISQCQRLYKYMGV